MRDYHRGWHIIWDHPSYGCDDNPSGAWFAHELQPNGHYSGRVLRADTRAALIERIDNA